jgi:hypothetical protein
MCNAVVLTTKLYRFRQKIARTAPLRISDILNLRLQTEIHGMVVVFIWLTPAIP